VAQYDAVAVAANAVQDTDIEAEMPRQSQPVGAVLPSTCQPSMSFEPCDAESTLLN